MINFDHLIEYEWNLFINHVSKYYPISPYLLAKYESEFNWSQIDSNTSIIWDRDLLDRYKENFRWWVFTPNANFHWEVEDIKRFKGYLDLNWLGRNKYFRVTEAFLEKPARKNFKVIENNIYLTSEMKDKYPDRINEYYDPQEKIISKEEVLKNIRSYDTSPSLSLYKHLIEEELDDDTLDNILSKKTDNIQKYYYLGLNKHILTYYHLPIKTSAHCIGEFEDYENEIKQLLGNQAKRLSLRGSLSDGKKIIPELIRLDNSGGLFLVSEHLRQLLEHFDENIFYDVDVAHKDLISDARFYVVSFNRRSLVLLTDFSRAAYKAYTRIDHRQRSHYKPIELSCKSREEFWEQRSGLRATNLELKIHSHPVNEPSDIFMKLNSLVVSEFLKEALEQVFPHHFKFRSATGLDITIPAEEYEKKKARYGGMDWKSLKIGYTTTTPDKEHIFFKRKRNRLKKTKPVIPQNAFSTDVYRDIEIKLNVTISKEIKERIKKELPEGYDLLPINEFYLQNDYARDEPQTIHSLIVATNGVGDELGFILEKDSDHSYDPGLIEFLHEIGDIEYIDQ